MIDGKPIKEELVDLYIDNIDTYKKVVEFTKDITGIYGHEWLALAEAFPDEYRVVD